jgi:hypothetical protein
MNSIRYLRSRLWALAATAVVLVAVHVTLFHVFRHVSSRCVLSGAVVSGLVLLLIAKHLGILGVLLGSLYARFRRLDEASPNKPLPSIQQSRSKCSVERQ